MKKNKLAIVLMVTVLGFVNQPFIVEAAGATLSLSPASISSGNGEVFTVNIIINTSSSPIDGVDILSLRFNPSILQVVDDNPSISGVQITPGSLLPVTALNSVDNTDGTIQFSAVTSEGKTYSGSGTLATIHFRPISGGTSSVKFDFTLGSTVDTNVAYQGVDQLSSITNGSYSIDATSPTVSISSPSSGANISGSVSVSANASDSGGSGLSGVQFKLDGANLGVEDATPPYSILWDSTTASNGSHSITAVARDGAGNTTTTGSINVAVSNSISFQRTIQLDLEARSNKTVPGTVSVLSLSKALLKSYTFNTNSSGLTNITFDLPFQSAYLKINVSPYLTKFVSVDLNSSATYVVPKLFIGDLNQDNIINTIDYSLLNSKWFTSDVSTDLNKDGVVNSIDFSYMNLHWLVSGDQ